MSSERNDNTGTRRSISRRLSSKLFFRLFWIFVSLNITICLIFAVSAAVYSERIAETAIMYMEAGYEYDTESRFTGVSDFFVTDAPAIAGFHVPRPINFLLPYGTRNLTRGVSASSDESPLGWRVDYDVYYPKGERIYRITTRLSGAIRVFRAALIALSFCELCTLIDKSIKNSRLIRRTLDPISQLAQATRTINDAAKTLDPEKMAAIAGELDNINASRLDRRVHVDSAQKELQGLATAINDMLDRINEAYLAQIRFVFDASHELRTPIAVIQGYANLLDRWGKNDEKTLGESIAAIKDEAAGMKELVERLLFLARGDNNTITLSEETFDLAELADEIVAETRMIDPAHTFESATAPAIVRADRALIKQTIRILVDNAQKYTDPGGVITLKTSCDGEDSKLSVSDDGIGIDADVLPRVFDRFVRADASRTRATGGSGLGLAIAKWIATRHGGHMEALSREGIGTRMTLVLPAATAAINN
jgi:signal transduction histidine kinase